MIEQLQQDYEALAKRVDALEIGMDLSILQSQYDALGARVSVLEASAVKLLTFADFQFIGGYRIPAAEVAGRSMAFSNGGLTGRIEANNLLRIWSSHHAATGHVGEFIAPSSRGTNTASRSTWPIATFVRTINNPYATLRAIDAYCQVMAVHWEPSINRLLVSGRSTYNTFGGKNAWLVPVNLSTGLAEAPITPNLSHQVYGGGIFSIPQDFADQYCDGATIGLGRGGYESGNGSSHSPSLAAWKPGANGKQIMASSWLCPKEQRERRTNNYSQGNVSWQIPPDGNVGYWGVDRVRASTWIKTPTKEGLVVLSRQPVGTLNYALQNEVFTTTGQTRMYVYDPKDLAKSAIGQVPLHSVRGVDHATAGWPENAVGMWWDNQRQILSVMFQGQWNVGGPEWHPVVQEYTVRA